MLCRNVCHITVNHVGFLLCNLRTALGEATEAAGRWFPLY